MDSIWTNGSWQVVTTSNDFLFHYFILFISFSLVLSYSSNGTQFISLSSIIDKVQRKGGPLISHRFQSERLSQHRELIHYIYIRKSLVQYFLSFSDNGAISGSGLAAAPYSCFPVLYLPFFVPVRMYVMNKCFACEGVQGKEGGKGRSLLFQSLACLLYSITQLLNAI